jgi:hypothetical protein
LNVAGYDTEYPYVEFVYLCCGTVAEYPATAEYGMFS